MLKTQGRGPSDFLANVALPLISQALNYSEEYQLTLATLISKPHPQAVWVCTQVQVAGTVCGD